jgi:hypothetical protein
MTRSASPGSAPWSTSKPAASSVWLGPVELLVGVAARLAGHDHVHRQAAEQRARATISTPRRVMLPPSKAIITRSGSVKSSVTARMGRCRARTMRSTLRPRSRCVVSADSPRRPSTNSRTCVLLLHQGLLQVAVALAHVRVVDAAADGALAQAVQEQPPLLARRLAARSSSSESL